MPKIVYWLAGILGIAQLIGILILLTPPDSTDKSTLRFEQASRCMETPSLNPLNSNGIAAMLDQASDTQESCWQEVVLPENNPIQEATVDLSHPQLVRAWYRISFIVPKDWPTEKPMMVFVPRIIANAWQIKIENQSIADNRFEWRSTWNRPVSATFYPKINQLGHSIAIELGVIASKAEGFSVSRISVGDAQVLLSQKAFREYLQLSIPQALSMVLLLLGFFFITLWFAHKSETEFFYLALCSIAHAVLYLRFTPTLSGNPARETWYNAFIIESPTAWIICLSYLFVARFAKFKMVWIEGVLWLQAIVISMVTLLPISSDYDFSLLQGTLSFFIAILCYGVINWIALIERNLELLLIAGLMDLGILGGLNDLALNLNLTNPEGLYLGPFFTVSLYCGFLYLIQRRYAAAILGQEQLNHDLAKRLAEREALTQRLTASESELRAQQNRLLEFKRAQTLAEERNRLMHDMHDGLGSSLLSTLAAIETTNMPQQAVAEALRACIEDLRLIIDSLEPTSNDLVTLLATIRYRLGQRLVSAGLEFKWEIENLPNLSWLEPPDALNILRLVQEALINILKHAKASSIRVSTRDLGQQVEIQVEDNGCGFDPNIISSGRGIHNLFNRAERLGGELHIHSRIGQGTLLCLLLPIKKGTTEI